MTYVPAPWPAGIVSVAEAAPLDTVPEVAEPTPGTVNVTLPLFTAPIGLVTVAFRVTVCADVL
jgi:hypothetical protein